MQRSGGSQSKNEKAIRRASGEMAVLLSQVCPLRGRGVSPGSPQGLTYRPVGQTAVLVSGVMFFLIILFQQDLDPRFRVRITNLSVR